MSRRLHALVVACGWTLLGASIAHAGLIKDHISDPANWSGLTPGPSYYAPAGGQNDVLVASFIGDGGKLSRVGVLFGVFSSAGVPNAVDPSNLDWNITFYPGYSDFVANSFSVNDALPETKVFNFPSNPDWLTIVGTGDAGFQLRYAEFDVSAENWMTTTGLLQGVAILPSNMGPSGGGTAFGLSNGTNAIGAEFDWYRSATEFGEIGPGTLQQVGAPHPYVAFRVETVTVPEPSTLILVLASAPILYLCSRRFR